MQPAILRITTLAAITGVCLWISLYEDALGDPPLRDITFATVGSHNLKLDLYLPQEVKNPPLVIFIHGGGWRHGSYKNCKTQWLTDDGFAVASIGYRLTNEAAFPAQLHDCKAAVRWLRKHADRYGYNAERIGVAGASAGGHLALLLGVTGGLAEFEGTVGDNLEQSSKVQAIVDYYGPADFVLRSRTHPSKTEDPDSPVRQLLGAPARENPRLAKFASPAYHVSQDDPPLLILHGDNDKTVYLDQSQRMVEEYRKADLDVRLEVVAGAGHGSAVLFTPEYRKKVASFLHAHLKQPQE